MREVSAWQEKKGEKQAELPEIKDGMPDFPEFSLMLSMPSKRQCIGCLSVSSVSAETIWRTNPNRTGPFRLLLQTVRMFRPHPTGIQTVETGRKKRKRKQQKLRRKRLPIRKTLQLP
ncbi:putative cell-division protein [Neisseria gonorrhoeae]|uniref:Putative cell-division protein n=1 Tax=Neisseria gonorrhoeae TaxID=485 RepID=A0A378VW48_NEIGO|nr:putative cell-division protein [Neisseria gonorrhoeae]